MTDLPLNHHFNDETKRCVRCGIALAYAIKNFDPCAADRFDAVTDHLLAGISAAMHDAVRAYGKLEPKFVIGLLLNLAADAAIESRFVQEDFVRTAGMAYETMLEKEGDA